METHEMPRKEKPCPLMWLAELQIGAHVDEPDEHAQRTPPRDSRVLSTELMRRRAERIEFAHRAALEAACEARRARSREYAEARKAGEPARTAEYNAAYAKRCAAVGSRNWLDILPHRVAIAQISVEREAFVLRAKGSGTATKDIARRMGVTVNRVDQIYQKALRRRRHPNGRTPIEKYFDERGFFDREWR